jgi:transposase
MLAVNELTLKKREAIRLRLNGLSLAQVKAKTGLSVPTIIKAVDAFKKAGWQGVEPEARGRKPSVGLNEKRDSAAIFESMFFCSKQKQGSFLSMNC